MIAILFAMALSAQEYSLNLAPRRECGLYREGEKITFLISILDRGKPVGGMTVKYVLHSDGAESPVMGDVVTKDDGAEVTVTAQTPGFILLEAEAFGPDGTFLRSGKGTRPLSGKTGVIVSPEKIRQAGGEPGDFDAFWKSRRELLDQVPLEVKMTERPLPEKMFERWKYENKLKVFEFEVACAGSMPVTGYLCKPAEAVPESLPLFLQFQEAGVRSAVMHYHNPAVQPMIFMEINAHGLKNGEEPVFYRDMGKKLQNYQFRGIQNRDTFYYHDMFLRVMRALDFAKTIPEWDRKNLIVKGWSQGGAQAIVAAALDPQVTLLLAKEPALCDLSAEKVRRRPGWPLGLVEFKDGRAVNESARIASEYYDIANFAKRITCRTFFLTGNCDFVCSPASVFAAYNNIPETTDKTMEIKDNAWHADFSGKGEEYMKTILARKKKEVKN